MVYMHASEVQYTYLMDINIKETIILISSLYLSPICLVVCLQHSKGFSWAEQSTFQFYFFHFLNLILLLFEILKSASSSVSLHATDFATSSEDI